MRRRQDQLQQPVREGGDGENDGDADLNGSVNIADFARLASAFNSPTGSWTSGDSNYDNLVNIGDFAPLATNFNQSVTMDAPRAPLGSDRLIDLIRDDFTRAGADADTIV